MISVQDNLDFRTEDCKYKKQLGHLLMILCGTSSFKINHPTPTHGMIGVIITYVYMHSKIASFVKSQFKCPSNYGHAKFVLLIFSIKICVCWQIYLCGKRRSRVDVFIGQVLLKQERFRLGERTGVTLHKSFRNRLKRLIEMVKAEL